VTARRAAWLAGGVLLTVYAATLAPGVTFWDSGEFIAAARTLGIPHPPGTPLFVALLAVWGRVFWFLPFAAACNLFAAVCTAFACGLLALWIARGTRAPLAAIACGITAGATVTVWQNATETEVYASSLLLVVAAIVAADRAGRTNERRWVVLAGYLLALAIPVHLSVLVGAPVAILLAIDRVDRAPDWRAGAALLGVAVGIAGVGRLSIGLTVAGVALIIVSAGFTHDAESRRAWLSPMTAILCTAALACSAVLILLVRARHDPAINQANPATLHQLEYVIGRRQYDVAGVWPRRAPAWLQIANWFEYAGWQFGLSLGPAVEPSVARVTLVVIFAALGLYGARWHRAADRRTWRAMLLLFVCGSVGVLVYLNFKAGASFAWTIVPDAARHEARDRDYFFALSFLAWGAWAGMGGVALSRRSAVPKIIGLAVPAMAIALNWSAVDRRVEPEASLPHEVASTLLDEAPPRAVLFVAGDNDTYPLWYLQQVEGVRPDVVVVTLPLLGARWYAREMQRRYDLIGSDAAVDFDALPHRIAERARELGRPVAVALSVAATDRNRIGDRWRTIGAVAVADSGAVAGEFVGVESPVAVDTAAVRRAAAAIAAWRLGRSAHPSLDPVNDYFLSVLSCPRWTLAPNHSAAVAASLDSLCNLR
jgi:hypothetical protein